MTFAAWFGLATSEASSGRNGRSPARARVRMVLGLLVLLNGILLLLVFRPPSRSLAERQQELEETRGRHEAVSRGVAQMRELRTKLQAGIQDGREFSEKNFLARKTAFSAMLEDLEQLASQNRLKPAGVNYRLNDERNQPGWVNVEVTLTVEGDYPDLVRFINRVEQSELFWMIDSLNVSGSPSRGLRLSLQMGTYLLPS